MFINQLKNEEKITINMFGKEKEITVFCTGDNKFDSNGHYKKDVFDFNQQELDTLNWFLENINIEDYSAKIVKYCNDEYSNYCDKTITIKELPSEIRIHSIAINIEKKESSKPEISFYGDCKCDLEHGICIGFKNKKFIGINSQDWTL